MALEPGAKLGPYEILAPIATAATESYKATDTRLKRTVTIKACPPHVLQNAERVTTLQHPHICALYGVLQEGPDGYVITEYVEGETLAERLKRGAMDVEDVMKTAIAIADALDKAHRHGVTHRGLNPSNVLLTTDGAKIADFGFAKPAAAADSPAPASQLTTRTVSAPSALMLSAAGYLAPEQFEGAEGDARTDIFAFGAILYEMLTGRPAFEGKTPAMLLAAVQTVEPESVTKLQPATPPALDYLIQQCLAKDPNQRLQTARDLLRHLQWISERSVRIEVQAGSAAGRRKRDRIMWGLAAALVLIGIGIVPTAYRYFASAPDTTEVHFSVSLPGTGNAAGGTPAYISPDGRWIASARLGANNGGLYLVQLGSATPKYLFEGTSFFFPFWSPDSKSLSFVTIDGKLKVTDVSGAPPQTISDAPLPAGGGTWSKDGVMVFSSAGLLYRVQAAGGQPVQLTTLDATMQETDHVLPCFLPDGRHFVFLAVSSQAKDSAIYVGSIDSKERTRLFQSEAAAIYASPGYLLFNRANAVFAQPFDAKSLKLTGEPIRLSDASLRQPAPTNSPNVLKSANVTASQNGVLVYRPFSGSPAQQTQTNGMVLTWVDRAAQSATRIGNPAVYAGMDIAPDGKRFAVHQHEGEGGDSWFFDAGRMQRLTFNTAQDNSMPIWSHDGTKIAFGSRRNGKWGLYVKASDGTGPEDLIFESELPKMPMSWSPDGKLLVFWVNDPKTHGDIWMVPVLGDRKPVPLLQTPADEQLAQVSPDGKWMAYQSNETGTFQIYVRPFPEGAGNKSQISSEGAPAGWPRWRGDGKELFFASAPNILAADIKVTGATIQPGIPHILFPINNPLTIAASHTPIFHPYAVTPDGQRFLVLQFPGAPTGGGGLAGGFASFVDNLAGGSIVTNTDSVNVVFNWTRSLKKK